MDTVTRQQVAELVEKFESRKSYFRSQQYNETQVRVEFVNPLFTALGWNVADSLQVTHEAYVQVEEDDGVKKPKRPDYAFRTDHTDRTRFFVETKKPSVNLKDDPTPAYQVRRYGWSAKLPVSILTDFEEFSVYDCRLKPTPEDRAQEGRLRFYTYQDYLTKWDEIEGLFSRRAVQENKLEDWIRGEKTRGAQEVDAAFLADLEKWREMLAKDIAQRNPGLSPRRLNTAVQMTLDRIIFLRICEDRGIEPYARLEDLVKSRSIYGELTQFFRQADAKYNSGLFHFSKEKERDEDPDEWTLNLKVDNAPLSTILLNLYFPHSPYAFDALPADILGQIYERFLGKVIEVSGQTVNVVEKPEVRKAGGVYYTPTYIVDYIVQNTVSKLLAGKTPEQVADLRILDPACGSGSFLIGAYQHLLDWHLDYYKQHAPKTHLKAGRLRQIDDAYSLTTAEKKRILKNNLYGVDLDQQAVEVTKLSLLLKLLEGETSTTTQIPTQTTMLTERVLPDLGDNVKWGNSLIGPDYYTQRQTQLSMWQMDEEELLRVKVFDWHDPVKGFGKIMAAGGFDTVIGNPPYIFTRNQGIDSEQKDYFYSRYKHQSSQLNTFGIFVEKSYSILANGGRLGFIIPNNWLTIDSFAVLRQFILMHTGDVFILNILDKVFQAASVDTAIVGFKKGSPSRLLIGEMGDGVKIFTADVALDEIKSPSYIIQINLLKDQSGGKLIRKIEDVSSPLHEFCTVSTGLKVYQTGKGKPPQTDEQKNSRIFHSHTKLDETYNRYLDGVDVGRYVLGWSGEYLSYGDWIAETRKSVPFDGERILVRQIPSRPPYLLNSVFTNEHYYNDINSMVIFDAIEPVSLKYLLGLINSKLISFWFIKTYDKLQRKIFPQFKVKELAQFPIRTINFDDPTEKARHDRMVSLVETMLDLHRQLPQAANDTARDAIQAAITTTDREIDRLVYDLYGLTDDEIRIVEGG